MSEPSPSAKRAEPGAARHRAPEAAPLSHRLFLWAYPQWFRDEFGAELAAHLARQRAEPRYREPALGQNFMFLSPPHPVP